MRQWPLAKKFGQVARAAARAFFTGRLWRGELSVPASAVNALIGGLTIEP